MSYEDLKNKERTRSERENRLDERSELNHLVSTGQWKRLKENPMFQEMDMVAKIDTALDAIDIRIGQANRLFSLAVIRNPQHASRILKSEITPMRHLKEVLAARLAGEFEEPQDTNQANDALGIVDKPKLQLKKAV
jgi:hypothetical protein